MTNQTEATVSTQVLEYLAARPNRSITATQISKALKTDTKSVVAALKEMPNVTKRTDSVKGKTFYTLYTSTPQAPTDNQAVS